MQPWADTQGILRVRTAPSLFGAPSNFNKKGQQVRLDILVINSYSDAHRTPISFCFFKILDPPLSDGVFIHLSTVHSFRRQGMFRGETTLHLRALHEIEV